MKLYIPAGNDELPQNPQVPYMVFDKYGAARRLETEDIAVDFQDIPVGGNDNIFISGFFTVSVDSDGNLWVTTAEGGTNPFEYDENTGNLYYIAE